MAQARVDLIARTREHWEPRAGRAISDEEAQEIIDNMVAFARLIIDWYLADPESCDRFVARTSASLGTGPECRE